MNDDFTFVPDKDHHSPIQYGHLICNHCGDRVETGIVTVSDHWLGCLKRTDGLIVARNSWERSVLDSMSVNT